MGHYDIAQICLKGHVANHSYKKYPQHNKKFCDICGSPTITTCPKCNSEIQGEYHVEGVIGSSGYVTPAFCRNCGAPFPWTEAKIKAAHEFAQSLNLGKEDKRVLEESIDDIVITTATTAASANKFKTILSKAGKTTLETGKEILTDILAETAKKIIWP
jgi:hypothetical protein